MSDLRELVKIGVDLYADACAYDAAAAFGDERVVEISNVAWSRYEGARTLLSMVFGITEEQVEEDMGQLMFSNLFE